MQRDSEDAPFFNSDALDQLDVTYLKLDTDHHNLVSKYIYLKFKNPDSREHAHQGFLRRLKTLKRCIENIWTICPPENLHKLSWDELTDLDINLQSFTLNTFGCLDNLAWVWVTEKNHSYKRKQEIGFPNKTFVALLSKDFQIYFQNLAPWFQHIKDYRDALAHRIPLYVPPLRLSKIEEAEYKGFEIAKWEALERRCLEDYELLDLAQAKLGQFLPYMTHSYNEKAPAVLFHAQVLADWVTILQFSEKFLLEL